MNAEDRKQKILQLLRENGKVKVTELEEKFGVSVVTIRNDLADMESKGMLSRVHGGAVSSYKPYYSMNLNQRLSTNENEKKAIAEKIAGMIENNDTLMLNSGTTTLAVFRMLPSELNLNIVTNSIAIALEASNNPNFNVVLVGGAVNGKYQFTFGNDAIAQIKNYHAEKLILSVDGVSSEGGFSTYYEKEAEIDRTMMACSDVCIIAADHSKLDRLAFAKISEIDKADYIVTNRGATKEFSKDILTHNCEIVLA